MHKSHVACVKYFHTNRAANMPSTKYQDLACPAFTSMQLGNKSCMLTLPRIYEFLKRELDA